MINRAIIITFAMALSLVAQARTGNQQLGEYCLSVTDCVSGLICHQNTCEADEGQCSSKEFCGICASSGKKDCATVTCSGNVSYSSESCNYEAPDNSIECPLSIASCSCNRPLTGTETCRVKNCFGDVVESYQATSAACRVRPPRNSPGTGGGGSGGGDGGGFTGDHDEYRYYADVCTRNRNSPDCLAYCEYRNIGLAICADDDDDVSGGSTNGVFRGDDDDRNHPPRPPSCRDQRGTSSCGSWVNAGFEPCAYSINDIGMVFIEERNCQSFDGCGNFVGTYAETREAGVCEQRGRGMPRRPRPH